MLPGGCPALTDALLGDRAGGVAIDQDTVILLADNWVICRPLWAYSAASSSSPSPLALSYFVSLGSGPRPGPPQS